MITRRMLWVIHQHLDASISGSYPVLRRYALGASPLGLDSQETLITVIVIDVLNLIEGISIQRGGISSGSCL